MSIQQIIQMLRAWRWLIIGVAAIVTVTAALYALSLPKTYVASSAVVVDIKGADPVSGTALSAQLLPGYIPTQIDIINSDRVALKVVQALKLAQSPDIREQWDKATGSEGSIDMWLVQMLKSKLRVSPSRESSVISIAFTANDPKFAAAVANAFAQAYIDVNLELKVEPARQYAVWFDERTRTLKTNLEEAQQRLSAFQRENGIVATADERLDIENARLNELSSQLSAVQAQRTDTSSRQRESASPDSLPEVVGNSLVQSLKAEMSRLEAERDQIASRYGANHPERRRNEAELAAVRSRLATETQRVASSIGAANRVNQSREAEVRGALEAQRRRVLQLRGKQDQIAVLQRDVEAAQRLYDVVTQRLAQSNLESQTQQTNIVVLTRAEPPTFPAAPNVVASTGMGGIIGLLIGIAMALVLELRNRRVRSTEDLISAIGVPVLTVLQAAPVPRRRAGWRPALT
ncbi:chain length determinant protein EpsF [Uliginosibacterium sp. H1]|uniref:chain length determinant protein EpsF n=1 Tax=Uliginosibacterium sp. H1 TaxID=3114757 RepID=UPI002E17A3D3|nr:chain length determinant protein EpsF [Uliginosibacterium sp. H1]